MDNLAKVTLNLLCAITFPPETGYDPEDLAGVEADAWQTLIHNLSLRELESFKTAVQGHVEYLRQLDQKSLPGNLRNMLSVLEQYLSGELQ